MISGPMLSKFAKWSSWIVPGGSFTVAVFSSITSSEFRPKLASEGSTILGVLWVVLSLLLIIFTVRPAPNARIVFPGKQVHMFFISAIAALWLPYFFESFKAQKVEIILDVSQRMGAEFNPPGTTKFDAAREGVLKVLSYLEDQNVEVALRLVNSGDGGQCQLEPESSLVVDFTRDLDQIRHLLDTLRPSPSDKAPVVDAIDFSIDHYRNERRFDQEFYIYSFLGGKDTCGEDVGIYWISPKAKEYAGNADFFLIILLGTDEEAFLRDLPDAKLNFARDALQVQQIVNDNNRLITISTPTATLTLSPASSEISPTPTPTTPVAVEPSQDIRDPHPVENTPRPPIQPPVAKTATHSPSATPFPSPTRTRTQVPSFTSAPTKTATNLPIVLPTNTPMGPHDWMALPPQPEVFAQSCPLLNDDRVYAKFTQSQAGITPTLVNGGRTNPVLRLDFSNASSDGGNYAGWEVWLGGDDYSGIDLSSYNSLVFFIKSQNGDEELNVWLMMPVLDDYDRYYKAVTDLTTSWQRIEIPLMEFTVGQGIHEEVDLHNIQRIQILFEWYPEPTSGRIFIDDLCVE
jgi:hypothetical protein